MPQEARDTVTKSEMQAMVRQAVADGLRDACNDREAVGNFWRAAFEQLQAQAQARTGKWVLRNFWRISSKLAMFIGIGMLVYSIGGWTAVAKLWHATWGAP